MAQKFLNGGDATADSPRSVEWPSSDELHALNTGGDGNLAAIQRILQNAVGALQEVVLENRRLRADVADLRKQDVSSAALLARYSAQHVELSMQLAAHDSALTQQVADLTDLRSLAREAAAVEGETRKRLDEQQRSTAIIGGDLKAFESQLQVVQGSSREALQRLGELSDRVASQQSAVSDLRRDIGATDSRLREEQQHLSGAIAARQAEHRRYEVHLDEHRTSIQNLELRVEQLEQLLTDLASRQGGGLRGTDPADLAKLSSPAQHADFENLRGSVETLAQRLNEVQKPPVYLGRGLILIRTARAFDLICRSDDIQITPVLLRQGLWEPQMVSLLEQVLQPGMNYLDIGANVGFFTAIAGGLIGHRGRLHAFEPHPEIYRLLQLNTALQRHSHICTLEPLAVADTAGERTLQSFRNNVASSTLSSLPSQLLRELQESPVPIPISCTTLDDYYSGSDMVFDLIKVDAEGAECLIFEGGKRFFEKNVSGNAIVWLECNPPALSGLGRTSADLIRLAQNAGFVIWNVGSDGLLEQVRSPEQLHTFAISDLVLSRTGTLPLQRLA